METHEFEPPKGNTLHKVKQWIRSKKLHLLPVPMNVLDNQRPSERVDGPDNLTFGALPGPFFLLSTS